MMAGFILAVCIHRRLAYKILKTSTRGIPNCRGQHRFPSSMHILYLSPWPKLVAKCFYFIGWMLILVLLIILYASRHLSQTSCSFKCTCKFVKMFLILVTLYKCKYVVSMATWCLIWELCIRVDVVNVVAYCSHTPMRDA